MSLEELEKRKKMLEKVLEETRQELETIKEKSLRAEKLEKDIYEKLVSSTDVYERAKLEVKYAKIIEKRRAIEQKLRELEEKYRGVRKEIEEIKKKIKAFTPSGKWIVEKES